MSAAPVEEPWGSPDPDWLDLDAVAVLEAIDSADRAERAASARKLALAYQWAVLHPATEESGVATADGSAALGILDHPESLGGPGTPAVAAFTPEPLAARLAITPAAAGQLIADALDLVHRLPRLWKRVQRLRVPAWQARRVAQQTHHLPHDSAIWVDDQLAARTHGPTSPVVVDRLLAHLSALTDPEAHRDAEQAEQATWDVVLTDPPPGLFTATSRLEATGDTLVLRELTDLVTALAHRLRQEGDTSPLGVRKITALRLITRAARRVASGQAELSGLDDLAGLLAEKSGTVRLVVHVDADDLEPPPPSHPEDHPFAVARVDRLGAATIAKLKQWVDHTHVQLLPVLNLHRTDAVDAHDPPAWMRELVILRDQTCVFPHCTRDARHCDLDHIDPFDPDGPPGQTSPLRLAALCRRHHRAKTHRSWRYTRTPAGLYQWTSPHGHVYLRTPTGTTRLT